MIGAKKSRHPLLAEDYLRALHFVVSANWKIPGYGRGNPQTQDVIGEPGGQLQLVPHDWTPSTIRCRLPARGQFQSRTMLSGFYTSVPVTFIDIQI
jgi:hypothetical protein